MRRLLLTLPAILSCLLAARSGHAATFDDATGRLTLDGAVTVGFDGVAPLPTALQAQVLDGAGQPLDAASVAALLVADAQGLEGGGYLLLGGDAQSLRLDLSGLAVRLTGHRIDIRFWQRPEGTALAGRLSWSLPVTGADPVALAAVLLQPTGRVTDDGWEEWTSGPLDYAALGAFPAGTLTLYDEQQSIPYGSNLTVDSTLRVRLDALEILDLGAAAVPAAACTAVTEADACGARGACLLGRCADAALRYGQMPVDPGLRADYLARLLYTFRTFEGARLAQAQMGQLTVGLGAAAIETSPAWFWRRLSEGISTLGDAHASPPSAGGTAGLFGNFGVCMHMGEADLLPDGGRAPMVFSIAGDGPLADALLVGDVLTRIDGLPPYEWARRVGLRAYMAGDGRAFDLVLSPYLLWAAMAGGSHATFSRCPHPGPAPLACSAADVESIDIDFAALAASTVLAGQDPDWVGRYASCDYRFTRALADPDVTSYTYAGWIDDGGVRTLIINGVPDPSWAPSWWGTVEGSLSPEPPRLIVDQRYGAGGAITPVDNMKGMLLTSAEFSRMEILPIFDEPLDDALLARLRACASAYGMCGGYFPWVLYEWSQLAPALRGVADGTRVAILNSYDVSGNDYTTHLFQYRSAPTRIFGGVSLGGFGPIIDLPSSPFDSSGGSMQLWDTVFLAHPGDPVTGFMSGIGIPPDDDVLERQSDAVQGIATVVAAARAWLLE